MKKGLILLAVCSDPQKLDLEDLTFGGHYMRLHATAPFFLRCVRHQQAIGMALRPAI